MSESQPQAPHTRLPQIILASSSPRRRQLMTEAGYEFEIIPPADDVECGVCSESGPAGLVAELAYRKAAAVVQQVLSRPGFASQSSRSTIIVAADTVAECDGFILGKPRDEADARDMLTKLRGRDHRVLTGVCLWPLTLAPPPLASAPAEPPLASAFPQPPLASSLPLPPGEGRGEGAPPTVKKPSLPLTLLQRARDLRKSQTDAEQLFWSLLRDRRFGDFKFRRQYPLDPYVLDFYCEEKNLAIELDGGQHNLEQSRRADERRTRHIERHGIRVLRFWNDDALHDTDSVLEAIWIALHKQSPSTLTPNPSPKGRGEQGPPLASASAQSPLASDLPLPPGEGRGEGAPPTRATLIPTPPDIRVAVSKLRMENLTDTQLDDYLASGAWEGKAGAFGYQDRLGWVQVIEGSESNVVGLPMELLADMLRDYDFHK